MCILFTYYSAWHTYSIMYFTYNTPRRQVKMHKHRQEWGRLGTLTHAAGGSETPVK